MRIPFKAAVLASLLAGSACLATAAPDTPQALGSGIDLTAMDRSVRPQDDLYRFTNGHWLDTTPIPADKGRYASFDVLRDRTQEQLRTIVDELAHREKLDIEQRKIADLYATFLDEASLEGKGVTPLKDEFARIDAVTERAQLAPLLAHLARIGVSVPFSAEVGQDDKDSTKYAVFLYQGGLGLPDRDYYLLDDARMKGVRDKYPAYLERMMKLAGLPDAPQAASAVLEFETELARAQWTRVENRDPVKTYNKTAIPALSTLVPGFDWGTYGNVSGYAGKVDYVVVSQPTYLQALAKLIAERPLPQWKAYLRVRLLSSFAPYLDKRFVDESFAFNGTTVRGVPENRPRWKRGLDLLEQSMGEALGKIYVAKYFPPESKARMDQLVANLLAAYKADVGNLAWMGEDTRKRAQAKLATFMPKIGYPVRWRDYGGLLIVRGDLVGDVIRARDFEHLRQIGKLGKPIDRDEWGMTPQTVNAYYNPSMNEIVFPAAILQPPFFNVQADDAVNYGGIGAVIGHEISHGFDDQGSQYDPQGNLLGTPGWFTQGDFDRYHALTNGLVQQYAAQEVLPGVKVNGELTLGENIADNCGLAIAYQAYRISLGGKPSAVIDGFTGEQRLYLGWAQVWRGKVRDEQMVVSVKTDPHSPDPVRGKLPVRNQAGFYQAFDVKQGDKMYLAPTERVTIW